MIRSLWVAAVAGVLGVAAPAGAAPTLLTDPFTDGQKVGGADNSGINWWDRSANNSLTVGADPTLGSSMLFSIVTTSRSFTGVLVGQKLDLVNDGDSIDLKFDFRFVAGPNNSTAGITFGLYNSNNSPVTAEDTVEQDNDFGFRADFGSGTTSAIFIGKESNSTAGGTGSGTPAGDTLAVGLNPGSIPVAVNDQLKHSAQMTLTKSPTGVDVAVYYDSVLVASGTSTSPFTSFDEIVIGQVGGANYRIDNVVLASNVPEPGVVGIVGAAVAVLGMRRRRNR
ncbi:MAG: PEP-CTERM sorting domain-containing protein [Phycisphaerae bacterium]|nr:PEP-CTERM sorting domain-containing protein [Tepidisphaeraceae bacterium]